MKRTKYVMRLRRDLIQKLNIARQIIEETFGTNSYAQFENSATSEFDNFSDTIPFYKDKNNQANFSYGPLLLATYRTLTKKYACTEVQAIEIISQIVEHLARHQLEHMNFILKILFKKVGRWSFLRNKMESFLKYRPENMGWAADMTTCGLYQWLTLNDTPQLCSLACDSDYVTVEYMPHLKLERKYTIAKGDSICSFRFIYQNVGAQHGSHNIQ